MFRKTLCLLLAAVMLLSAAVYGEGSAKKTVRVFETTDIHGYLLNTSTGDENSFQYRMAYIASEVNRARETYDDVLLLNGGNNYEGTPVSNLLEGSAIRAAFSASSCFLYRTFPMVQSA